MMPPRTLKGSTLLLIALAAGCGAMDGSPWILTESESALDGKTVTATQRFTTPESVTVLDVTIRCTRSQKLDVAVGSYMKVEKDAMNAPSEFLLDDDGDLRGRIAFADLDGTRQVDDIWNYFALEDYTNVAAWDVTLTAASAMLLRAPEQFFLWASPHVPNRTGTAAQIARQLQTETQSDEFIENVMLQVMSDHPHIMAAVIWGEELAAEEMISEEISEETMLEYWIETVLDDLYGYAAAKNDFAPLASGAFLQALLPVTLQVFNNGGAQEVTISDDPNVRRVLIACGDSNAWWSPGVEPENHPALDSEAPPVASPAARQEEPPVVTHPEKTVVSESPVAVAAPTAAAPASADAVTRSLDDLFRTCSPDWEALNPFNGVPMGLDYHGLTVSGIFMAGDGEGDVVQVFFDDPENLADLSPMIETLWGEQHLSHGSRGTFMSQRKFQSTQDGVTERVILRTERLRFITRDGEPGERSEEAELFPFAPESAYHVIECRTERMH
jgi:hypothetical protein